MMRRSLEARSRSPSRSPPSSPDYRRQAPSPEQVRRSFRLEERKRTSLGVFLGLPIEVLQHMLSYMPARSLSQLAQVSTGWHQFLQDWIQLRSSAWIVAPKRRCRYLSDEFYDEYTELGLLCRRLLPGSTLPQRAHACWRVLEAVEQASMRHDDRREYEPTFIGAANFFRAAVALSCSRSQGERFETMWQIVRDTISADMCVLEARPGEYGRVETDLRLALRVLFLSPSAPPRHVRFRRMDRGTALRALLCRLPLPLQARTLFVCYGPRTGAHIDWARPCDAGFATVSQMVHVVAELGSALDVLAKRSHPQFIHNLVSQLTKTPAPWLPRYEVMLYLTMGERAAAAVLAGFARKVFPKDSRYVVTRLSQIASLSEMYRSKLEAGNFASGPVFTAATTSILEIVKNLCRFLPGNYSPVSLLQQVTIQTFFLSYNVGGDEFSTRVMASLDAVLTYYQ
ncbi:uncharacterized protein LOC113203403 isoform X11 [Frankliniella occidentalis]|uniref:Uncharacterized protein LOC113203403 isoform X10 n=1 Tax=Frankliniella occidentalis TaxID=133901 RepID=A0A6J1S524_FRAOC|nr:uncharacterized protein LOC113203403 isoform X7 [Frankliniella occidentalis]XP_052119720.1 uncharacterized protein LOC113203403 isoform X8 [Frankliniella occidentalis]XP_052119721.1 uncharacterized protein LOC113203403 isoform X9 [Frankliniella occidentalis]XP_052119722.1 uncharacterized protein LOC113203403 isoform X10 [Frankliniella occidentalis]XP_052119723.1 uncharacterized protein LOC113203403 isoform X11 [Frankliniella occidentalis]